MALSLKKLGRNIWETLTPQNEGALRAGERSIQSANRQLQQRPAKYGVLSDPGRRQQFIEQNQPEPFNLRGTAAREGFNALSEFAGGVKRFGQSVASAAASPYAERLANQEAERAKRLLTPAYGDIAADVESGRIKYDLMTDPMRRAGISPNDSLGTTARKVGAQGVEAALDIATAGTGPAAFKAARLGAAVRPSVKAGALLGGGANAAYLAQGDDLKLKDAALSVGTGAVLGGALPALSAKAANIRRPQVKPRVDAPLPAVAKQGGLRTTEKLSPDRGIRAGTRKVEESTNRAIYNASVSENPITRGTARLVQGISREAGMTEGLKSARRKLRGTAELGKVKGSDLAEAGRKLEMDSRTRVWATIDTDQAAKMGRTVDPASLTPEEQALRQNIIGSIEETTQGNLERGLITQEQAANPNYLKRAYEPFEAASDKQLEDATRRGLLKQFRGRKEVSEDLLNQAITDPAYLAGKKAAQSHQAWAIADYSNYLADNGFAFPQGGRGMVQLPADKLYGKAAGQWVPKNIADDFTGFKYTNAMLNAFNDIITAYDSLGVRRAKKQLLTVFNPAVRLGNQLSNRMFAFLNGMNPVEFEKAFQKSKGAIKSRDPMYMEAVQQGLVGTDITRADLLQNIAQHIDDPDILKQGGALKWFQKSYSEADDRAKIAAYTIHRAKGYSPEDAARLTQRGFQDYSSVGFFYDMAAKTPVFGNAFVRFAGDSMRIGKNALADHPLRVAGLVGTWATLTNVMSKVSGETPEDRQTREDRFGAPKIPFSDISLAVQTPFGELNVARFLPFYNLNEVGSEASRFLPVQTNPFDGPKNFQDPLLGQAAQIFMDQDFRGRSIQDPENVEYADGVKKYTELPDKDRRNNLLRFAFGQNVPLGREADAIYSAAKGKKDIYGKTRTLPQAALRAGGVKVEQFGPEQAKETRERNKYFEGNVERTKDFLKKNPDLKEAYYKFKGPTIDRKTGKKASDLVSPERWKIVSADRSGKLYGFLKSEALLSNKEDGRPVDPVFKLPTQEQAKQVMELRSRPTGDDIETEEILRATQPWYEKFEDAESKYYKENSKFFSKLDLGDTQNARPKAYAAVKYPKQSDLVKKYYQTKSQSAEAGKQFYKDNADRLSADFEGYRKKRLEYINAKRKIEGFPPISANAFNNVTFGYEDDERKVLKELSFKYGSGFGFGKKRPPTAGSAYKYAVSLNAAGEQVKPKVSVRKSGGVKSTIKQTAKPKVTLKRSTV